MDAVTLHEAGGWSGVLGALTGGGDLTEETAAAAMAEILDGNATAAQIAGFIIALRMKGETVEELTGLVAAMVGGNFPNCSIPASTSPPPVCRSTAADALANRRLSSR